MNARPGPAEERVGGKSRQRGVGEGNINIIISSSDLHPCGMTKAPDNGDAEPDINA